MEALLGIAIVVMLGVIAILVGKANDRIQELQEDLKESAENIVEELEKLRWRAERAESDAMVQRFEEKAAQVESAKEADAKGID